MNRIEGLIKKPENNGNDGIFNVALYHAMSIIKEEGCLKESDNEEGKEES